MNTLLGFEVDWIEQVYRARFEWLWFFWTYHASHSSRSPNRRIIRYDTEGRALRHRVQWSTALEAVLISGAPRRHSSINCSVLCRPRSRATRPFGRCPYEWRTTNIVLLSRLVMFHQNAEKHNESTECLNSRFVCGTHPTTLPIGRIGGKVGVWSATTTSEAGSWSTSSPHYHWISCCLSCCRTRTLFGGRNSSASFDLSDSSKYSDSWRYDCYAVTAVVCHGHSAVVPSSSGIDPTLVGLFLCLKTFLAVERNDTPLNRLEIRNREPMRYTIHDWRRTISWSAPPIDFYFVESCVEALKCKQYLRKPSPLAPRPSPLAFVCLTNWNFLDVDVFRAVWGEHASESCRGATDQVDRTHVLCRPSGGEIPCRVKK